MEQATTYKNGAWVIFDKSGPLYTVKIYRPSGELQDKVRCDDYRMAREYHKAFKAIARNMA